MMSPVGLLQFEFLVPVALVVVALIIGSLIYFVNKLNSGRGEDVDDEGVYVERPREEDEPAVRAPVQRGRAARNRMVRQAHRQQENEVDIEQSEEEFVDDLGKTKKVGAKKARKIEMKAERLAQREQDLAEREERKQRQEFLDEQRQKETEKEELIEKENEEEEITKKEEQERQEHEQYLLMKECFEVHEEGFQKILSESESQNLLQEFINYIKEKKVVLLEDLGAQFNMKTQEAITRVHELQEQGFLTGVVDDRGKFIFISQEELEGVARFMRQRGRVSISELAEASNTLVFLQPENDPTLPQMLLAEV